MPLAPPHRCCRRLAFRCDDTGTRSFSSWWVDQFFLVAEEVRARKLAPVDDFSAAVAASRYVELPLLVGHQPVVRVERTDENVVVCLVFVHDRM